MDVIVIASEMKVTDLIEDCLVRIFSLLENNDLVNVVQVNSQFREIGRRVFSKNNKWLDILSAFENTKRSNAQNAFTKTKNLLEQFGDLIVSTGFDYTNIKKAMMRKDVHDLILKHCSKTLEEINFLGISDSLKFTEPFSKVKSLYFYDGSFHHSMSEVHRFFPNVETISFNNVQGLSWQWGFQTQHIPSLKSFDNGYDASHYTPKPNMGWYVNVMQINHFIARNPQLHEFSTSLNSHECCHDSISYSLERVVIEIPNNERKVNDHPISFKITVKSCAADCNVFDRLIVPYVRVESLELCLKGLTASEFITKCGNIKKLKLYLRFDSNLFNASYFKHISTALPLLEELFLVLETKQKYDYFAQFMDTPPAQTKGINYEKGSIHRAIFPFISQCEQLVKIEYRHSFDSRKIDDSKEFSRLYTMDLNDFEKTIRAVQSNWTSDNKRIDNFGSISHICRLTKQQESSLKGK